MTDDRLDWHLWNWRQWHQRSHFGAMREHWYPGRADGGIGQSGSSDFDAMVAAVDARCAAAVESALDDCSTTERCAVHHIQLQAVFRMRANVQEAYEAAREIIRKGLTRRGIL